MEEITQDPVAFCIEALQNASNKELALEQAKIAYKQWWVVYVTEKNLSETELMDLLRMRAIVIATIATVYVWNHEFSSLNELEEEFLFNSELWVDNNRQVIDAYLMQLIIQRQTDHLKVIFEDKEFQDSFLEYEDVYLSLLNPDYEFKSDGGVFVTLVNRMNSYSRMLTGKKLL